MASDCSRRTCQHDDLELETCKWISWFNEERIHGELNELTPAEVEANYADQDQANAA